jgi:acylphosphatase
MERWRIRFAGRVQGVGFRATARSVAGGFVVTGWVRNEDDGCVLLEVQGEESAVEAFLAALRRVMAGNIRSEQAEPAATAEGEADFEIRR